jgi:hypothetical protein
LNINIDVNIQKGSWPGAFGPRNRIFSWGPDAIGLDAITLEPPQKMCVVSAKRAGGMKK